MKEKKLNSEAVQDRMEQKGFNQAGVAAKLGVTRETVSQWLKNNKTPRPRHLLELAEVLDLSYDEVVMRYEAAEPQVAYRLHRNKTVSADMGVMLRNIIPYLSAESFFKLAALENPKLDSDYIQNIIGKVNRNFSLETGGEYTFYLDVFD
jgi:transcriptional regulator with XRE-family HTH domain